MNHFLKKTLSSGAVLFFLTASFFAGIYVDAKLSNSSVATVSPVINKATGQPYGIDFANFWKVWTTLDQKFVDTATSTNKKGEQTKERVYGAIQGMVDSLGDPYTVFLTPDENKNLETELSGSLEGVGMEVGIKGQDIVVVSPLKNSPAERAGVLAGDKILKIDNTTVSGFDVSSAVKLIRGKKGTTVTLTISREGASAPIVVSIVRDVINIPILETEKKEKEKVFVIKVHSFSANVSFLFRKALQEYFDSGYTKMVLDLRNNPGGYLESAVDMASWFLPSGKVVVSEDFGPNKKGDDYRSVGYDAFKSKPFKLVILVNGGSASASEILAGSLSEYKVGVLVGEKTFGKGSVQELVPISDDGAALKVTIARWLTPNGVSISKSGLVPNFEIKMTADDVKAGRDPQMNKALDVLSSM